MNIKCQILHIVNLFNKICDWEPITGSDDLNENTNQKTDVIINSTETLISLYLLHIFKHLLWLLKYSMF